MKTFMKLAKAGFYVIMAVLIGLCALDGDLMSCNNLNNLLNEEDD